MYKFVEIRYDRSPALFIFGNGVIAMSDFEETGKQGAEYAFW